MPKNFKLCATIALALLTTSCGSAPKPTTGSSASPSGFCDRTPPPPTERVGGLRPAWADWLGTVLMNYDCTCPGGRYYGKDDPLCKVG